jgi:hypothetical protein
MTQEEGERSAADARNYNQDFVTVDGVRIQVTSPDMGALAWQDKDGGPSTARVS